MRGEDGVMLRRELSVDTSRRQIIDLTGEAEGFCRNQQDGLLVVFVPHATAGLAIIETGAGSETDLIAALNELLPRDDRYDHRHGHRGHGADHLLPAFVSPSLTVPVSAGRPELGTWQHIVLVDLNSSNSQRQVLLRFFAG